MAYRKAPEDKNNVNEPDAGYSATGHKGVRVFHSFEEMENADALAAANKPPAERLRDTVKLILRVYGVTREDLKKRKKPLHITITKYE